MSKKAVSLLVVVLMILSAIPVALPVAFVRADNSPQVTHTVTKVNAILQKVLQR